MIAVQCRTLKRDRDGVNYYRRLCTTVHPGPILIHQTYANLLDEIGEHEEALAHREQAVKLEPEPWTYSGWANTLEQMGRHQEAGKVRRTADQLVPGSQR